MKYDKNLNLKIIDFNLKEFINIAVKCILGQIFNEIVGSQNLYMNKDDF